MRSIARSARACTRIRSTESITISAKKPSRTSWRFASATAFSNRYGTTTISITCRSRWPKPSASSIVALSMKRRARCATWCRITSSRWFRSQRWNRRIRSTPSLFAMRRPRCCAESARSNPKTSRNGRCAGNTEPALSKVSRRRVIARSRRSIPNPAPKLTSR